MPSIWPKTRRHHGSFTRSGHSRSWLNKLRTAPSHQPGTVGQCKVLLLRAFAEGLLADDFGAFIVAESGRNQLRRPCRPTIYKHHYGRRGLNRFGWVCREGLLCELLAFQSRDRTVLE